MAEISILSQRRIEAAFAKRVYEVMAEEVGAEAARRILARAVIGMAKDAAAALAREAPQGRTSLDGFRSILSRWTADDALHIDVLKSNDRELHFNVTRCRYAEMYRELGLAELGAVLSCNRDAAFCEGYDPALKLERTQTLMQGASHCDFRYRYEKD
jgi:hypothetical protein